MNWVTFWTGVFPSVAGTLVVFVMWLKERRNRG